MATRATWDPTPPVADRYTRVAILLHWTIAALILYNLVTGFFGESLPSWMFAFHISSGVTILVLTVVRVVWRLTHPRPPYPPQMKGWEKGLAHLNHFLLYCAMLFSPFTGWAMVSANPPAGSPGAAAQAAERAAHLPPGTPAPPPHRHGPMIWGVAPLPLIGPLQEIGREPAGLPAQHAKHEQLESLHLIGAYIMVALLLLHVAGALKHQLVDRWPELARMGIGRTRRPSF